MTAPRLEIDLDKIHHNASELVERLGDRGISVTGVTKATFGSPRIAETLLQSGVRGLGESRIERIEALRRAGVRAPISLIRSPMLSQSDRVVMAADLSFNTELDVIRGLSSAARRLGLMHGIVLMVELGDLREGIMPVDVEDTVRETLRLPNVVLRGIGTNLACRSGVTPGVGNMSELSALASSLEARFGRTFDVVSGGNSANLDWAFSAADKGRVNDLRLGESLLLGREALHRRAIEGLHIDAITLVAEVIESKVKPSQPWGEIAQSAFGEQAPAEDRGDISQTILAVGRQDTDPEGLSSSSELEILGASSDHLIVHSGGGQIAIGAEIRFQLNYSALMRAMSSPLVAKVLKTERGDTTIRAVNALAAGDSVPIAASPTGEQVL